MKFKTSIMIDGEDKSKIRSQQHSIASHNIKDQHVKAKLAKHTERKRVIDYSSTEKSRDRDSDTRQEVDEISTESEETSVRVKDAVMRSHMRVIKNSCSTESSSECSSTLQTSISVSSSVSSITTPDTSINYSPSKNSFASDSFSTRRSKGKNYTRVRSARHRKPRNFLQENPLYEKALNKLFCIEDLTSVKRQEYKQPSSTLQIIPPKEVAEVATQQESNSSIAETMTTRVNSGLSIGKLVLGFKSKEAPSSSVLEKRSEKVEVSDASLPRGLMIVHGNQFDYLDARKITKSELRELA